MIFTALFFLMFPSYYPVIVHVRHVSAHTGLLNDVDSDYYVTPSPDRAGSYQQEPYRGLAGSYQRAELPYQDIDQRFGDSTLPSIRTEFEERRRDKMTMPPRGLFDDV